MAKRITTIVFLLILVFSLVSLSNGFDNNKGNFDPVTKEPIPYTSDNINNGTLNGGHDTITAEGMKLKLDVHKGDKAFEDFASQSLPSLRTGAHDEDTYRYPFTNKYYNNDTPIGQNKDIDGDFFNHFLDPNRVYKTTLCTKDVGEKREHLSPFFPVMYFIFFTFGGGD